MYRKQKSLSHTSRPHSYWIIGEQQASEWENTAKRYIYSQAAAVPVHWLPPTPTPKKTRWICINLRNGLWQKWGGHVHPSPPRGDALVQPKGLLCLIVRQSSVIPTVPATVISSFSRQFITTIIITTFTMHHSISVPLQTQNLPFPEILSTIVPTHLLVRISRIFMTISGLNCLSFYFVLFFSFHLFLFYSCERLSWFNPLLNCKLNPSTFLPFSFLSFPRHSTSQLAQRQPAEKYIYQRLCPKLNLLRLLRCFAHLSAWNRWHVFTKNSF